MADVLSQDGLGSEPRRDRRDDTAQAASKPEREDRSRPGPEQEINGPFEIIIGAESFGGAPAIPSAKLAVTHSEPEEARGDPDLGSPDEPRPRSIAHFSTELLAALVLIGVGGVLVYTLALNSDSRVTGAARSVVQGASLLAPSERPDPPLPAPIDDTVPIPAMPIAVDTLALETAPSSAELDEREAVNAQRHGEYDHALALYERVLASEPGRPVALNNKGALLLHRGDVAAAVACFQAALEADPQYTEALNNLGVAARRSGDHHAAEEYFRQVLALDGSSSDARFNLALELYDRGALDQARACVAPLLELDGLRIVKAEAARLMARIEAEARPTEADQHLQAAAGILPEEELLGDLGALHLLARDMDRALDEIERLLKIREDPRMLSNRGVINLTLGRAEAALEDFDRALALAPNLIEARFNRALACESRGDFLGALSAYEQILEQAPEHVGARHNLGLLYLRGERPDEALAMLEAAPKSAQSPALDHLKGVVLERLRKQ